MPKHIVYAGSSLRVLSLFAIAAAVLVQEDVIPDMRAVLSAADKMKTGKLQHQDIRPMRDLRPTHQGVRAQAPLYHRARNRLG